MRKRRIAIIGAGAAGCFCAVNIKKRMPEAEVTVYESGRKPLAKVAITGGGRCNLTNSFEHVRSVKEAYPRGEKLMKRALKVFSNNDVMAWFEREGVALTVQADGCVFPFSQDAMEIVCTLTRLMNRYGVRLLCDRRISQITPLSDGGYEIDGSRYEKVVVATGGAPTLSRLSFLDAFQLEKLECVPSLFTFNIENKALHSLMGTVVEDVTARLTGTKFSASGPLLITHWGLSGPAILKLSSYGARVLKEREYHMEVAINWFGEERETEVAERLRVLVSENGKKQLSSVYPEELVQRLWLFLLDRAALSPQKRWQELGAKQLNRLAALLTNDTYAISGKGAYKEEFVTCGGIALSNINPSTMESKAYQGLFFAGEVLDVDAITGGYNLQAAWTMGYISACSVTEEEVVVEEEP